MSEWISVKDRLPEATNGMFLVCYRFMGKYSARMVVAWYGGKFRDIETRIVDVTHWMPLPAPPEEQK